MTPVQLVEKVRRHGVELVAAGNRIRYRSRAALPSRLRAELLACKAEVIHLLRSGRNSHRWDPLLPVGWTAEAWRGRLSYMARICMHHDRAEELRAWAAAVADAYGLSVEASQ